MIYLARKQEKQKPSCSMNLWLWVFDRETYFSICNKFCREIIYTYIHVHIFIYICVCVCIWSGNACERNMGFHSMYYEDGWKSKKKQIYQSECEKRWTGHSSETMDRTFIRDHLLVFRRSLSATISENTCFSFLFSNFIIIFFTTSKKPLYLLISFAV